MDNPNANEKEIKEMEEKLQDIYYKLVIKADKSELKEVIDKAKEIDENQYTVESIQLLKDTLDNIEKIYVDENVSQAEVKAAIETLNKMLDSLVKKVDKTELEKIIKEAETIDEELYTPNSVENFKKIVEDVKMNMPDDNASVEDIEKAIKEVQEAYLLLEPRADNSQLIKIIKEVEKMDQTLYTKKSLEVLNKEITKAKELVEDGNAKVSQINEAIENIIRAKNSLVSINNVSLNELINQIEKIDLALYTQDSINDLKVALEEAKKAMVSSDQDKIDNAYDMLKKAKDGLIKKTIGEKPSQPQEKPTQPVTPSIPTTVDPEDTKEEVLGEKINLKDTKEEKKTNQVKTNDSTMIIPFILLSLCAAGAYITIKKENL